MMSPDDAKKLKVQELKDELAARGLDTSGLKAVLLERLEEALQVTDNGSEAAAVPAQAHPVEATAKDTADLVSVVATAVAEAFEADVGVPVEQGAQSAVELSSQALQKALTEEEKRKLRDQRFGSTAAGGAGIGALGKVDLAEEIKKRKERAKKFGLPMPIFAVEEELKKVQRRERFGLPPSKQEQVKLDAEKRAAAEKDILEKKKARADRFGITKESDKADARAKRFGKPTEGGPVAKKAATSPDAIPALSEKLKARAARFCVPVPTK